MQRFQEQVDERGRRSFTTADVARFIRKMRAVRESEERLTYWIESLAREDGDLLPKRKGGPDAAGLS